MQREFPVAWNNLGNALRMIGQVEEAELCFSEALLQNPGYLSAIKNRSAPLAVFKQLADLPNVHLMLGQIPDWRWLLDAGRTDWYPTMTLYRQQSFGQWDQVMTRIVRKLSV